MKAKLEQRLQCLKCNLKPPNTVSHAGHLSFTSLIEMLHTIYKDTSVGDFCFVWVWRLINRECKKLYIKTLKEMQTNIFLLGAGDNEHGVDIFFSLISLWNLRSNCLVFHFRVNSSRVKTVSHIREYRGLANQIVRKMCMWLINN